MEQSENAEKIDSGSEEGESNVCMYTTNFGFYFEMVDTTKDQSGDSSYNQFWFFMKVVDIFAATNMGTKVTFFFLACLRRARCSHQAQTGSYRADCAGAPDREQRGKEQWQETREGARGNRLGQSERR